eukprot:6669280-Prymnesium_polylepis.1
MPLSRLFLDLKGFFPGISRSVQFAGEHTLGVLLACCRSSSTPSRKSTAWCRGGSSPSSGSVRPSPASPAP